MELQEFVNNLRKSHFSLTVEDGKLNLIGDKSKLTKDEIQAIRSNQEIIGFIKEHRDELIDYISANSTPATFKKTKDISSIYRLSGLQEGMLFHGLYHEKAEAYVGQFSCNISNVNLAAFNDSWNYVLKQHSILRTAFYYDAFNIPVQAVHKDVKLPIEVVDFSGMSVADQAEAISAFEKSDRLKGFDFKRPPLMRISFMRLAEDSYRMLWTTHHILFDGWSLPIMMEEFLSMYELLVAGKPIKLKGEDLYEEYIRYIERKDKRQAEQYWRDYLKGVQQSTLLPFINTTNERTKGVGLYKSLSIDIPSAATEKIQNFAKENRLTVNTIIQGVWSILLHRYTGSNNVVYGVIVSGRPDDLPAVERRVGMYINTLPLHSSLNNTTNIVEWLQEQQADQVKSREHQYTPLHETQRLTGVQGDLFDTLLVFENYPVSKIISAQKWSLHFDNVEMREQTNYPLTIVVNSAEQINVKFSYNDQVLDEAYVAQIRDQFEHVLLQVAGDKINDISEIKVNTPGQEQHLLFEFNNTRVLYPQDKTIIDLFEEQVEKAPKMVAVVFEQKQLTYKELNEKSNQLARYLQSRGVGPETLVPIFTARSIEMLIGILGILKAGGAYVPIDPEYPTDRISYILDDITSNCIVASKESKDRLPVKLGLEIIELSESNEIINSQSTINPRTVIQSNNAAYVIYTSGSTGKPKGTINEHKGIYNRLLWAKNYFSISSSDVILQKTPYTFDVSVWELLGSVIAGSTLVFAKPDGHKDNEYLKRIVEEQNVTILHFVPSMLELFLSDVTKSEIGRLKKVLCSGEALKLSQVKTFRKRLPGIELHNLYGPTEAAIDVTCWSLPSTNKTLDLIPIGKPVHNTQIYILDKQGQVLPIGVVGEVHIGGRQVGRGYLNKQALTEEKFITDTFSKEEGTKLYKTGDLGRWLLDGNIEFLGRIDDQVKIRGFRIELGEIETVLQQSGLVHQSVVLAKEDAKGNKRLLAYVVANEVFKTDAAIRYLQERLPDYMVPAFWVEMEKLPLTSNGKIDRKALPNPDMAAQKAHEFIAPRNETEQKVAEIWQETLGLEKVGIHDSFFELGGHSILAMQAISSLRRKLKFEVGIKDLFARPTVALLSGYLNEQGKGNLLPAIKADARPSKIPLSFSQERLWFIDQLEGSRQYHMPAVLSIKGNLNVQALENTLNDIINRHEVLRSVIRQHEGQPYQLPKEINQWSLEVIDERVCAERKKDLNSFIQELIQKPFDLSEDFMLRAHLITIAPHDYVLVVTLHHIASDGWSRSILVKELVEIYASYKKGRAANLSPLPIQYADFAIWQRSYLRKEVLDKKMEYWTHQLEGVATINLPTDFTRPAIQSTNGASVEFAVSQLVSDKINELNRAQGTTLYMTLLAVFKVLLYRYSGQNDICVGTGIAGRQQHETEGLIGFFVNTLAMRSQVHGESIFSDFLQAVKATTLEAYAHQEVPFEKIVDAVVHERDLSRNPLLQVTFIVQNTPDIPQLILDEVELGILEFDHITSRFDISFGVKPTGNGIEFLVEYCADLFSAETIERMVGHYKQLLTAVLEDPEQKIDSLLLITQHEERQLAAFSNVGLIAPTLEETLVSLFEKQAVKSPDAIALVLEEQTMTYKVLNEKANQLARFLSASGVGAETLVPLCIERSTGMIISILGILKAGGAYVPIDPSYPPERIDFMLQDTKANLVVASADTSERVPNKSGISKVVIDGFDKELIDTQSVSNLSVPVEQDQLAYVIYTSGSTGRPKGVLVEHRSIANFITAQSQYFNIGSIERIVQFSNYCFDASIEQIFLALTNGASLILFKEGFQLNPEQFSTFLNEARVTHLHSTPFFLENLIPEKCNFLRRVVSAGDLCRRELVNKWKGVASFYNKYGPTETAISVLEYKVEIDSLKNSTSVPIGKPVSNVAVYILNKNYTVCPIGIPGEIYIGGIQVTRGYLNRPDLTSERFVEHLSPFLPPRLYRTGDMGRWLADGNLEYLGRIDDQVKVHGYRIEIGEIESALNELSFVDNSCVVVKEDKETRNNHLVAYFIPNQSAVKLKENQLYDEQVASWKEIHENEYVSAAENIEDPEFNILGWNDSFTRNPIPKEHMREWLIDIVNVICSGKVERVLEIGSGSGLIYYQLAGKVAKYIGTDFSRASIEMIRNRISLGLRDYGPTELQVSAAHEVRVDVGEAIDTIVLNSIIQYFPGQGYLSNVIENCISILHEKGRIVIGDVRDLRTLKLFKARLKLEKLPDYVSIQEFNWGVEQDMLTEEELCFSPEYFYGLKAKYPQISHVEIVWKHGSYINELTAYRFTAVIYVGMQKQVFEPEWQIWNSVVGSAKAIAQLEDGVPVIAIKQMPNPRLQRESKLLETIKNGSAKNVGQLAAILADVGEADEVSKLITNVEAKGYSYKLLVDEDPLKLNILIEQTPSDQFIELANYSTKNVNGEMVPLTNIPLFNDISSQLQKDIKNLVLKKLPEYMLPSKFVAIQKMPLNNNGKIDRKFLSLIENTASDSRGNYVAPRNDLEKSIADIWKSLLNIDQAGINDNFFELGGHSLLAVRVISAIRKRLNIDLGVRDIFSYPTIKELAVYLKTLDKSSSLSPIKVGPRPENIPLSFSQERLWFIDQLEGSVQYHIPAVLRLKGKLNIPALRNSLQAVVERHEVLRTVIKQEKGRGYQYILPNEQLELEFVDEKIYEDSQADLEKLVFQKIKKPFDLSKDLMIRASLIRLGNEEHLLVITMHHIASDGWSTSIVVKEVMEGYESGLKGEKAPLLPLKLQYADFAIWQRNFLRDEVLDNKIGYWREKLKDLSPLHMPTDFPRPAIQSTRGSIVNFSIEKDVVDKITTVSKEQGATFFMTLLTAFKILLHKYTGEEDICIGTPVAGRLQEEVEGLIGFFLNTLAIRTNLNGKISFVDLLQVVKETVLEAFEHQDVPFERVVEAVASERDMSRKPVFQVMFVLHNTPDIPNINLANIELHNEILPHTTSMFDFTLSLKETSGGLLGGLEYCTDLFDEYSIQQLVRCFKELLSSIVAEPKTAVSQLRILNKRQEQQLLGDLNDEQTDYSKQKTIVDLFEEQVLQTPDAIAVVFEDQQISYLQLNEKANRLGHYLKSKGVKEDLCVPICIERSVDLIVGILGILKAGGAYVPIDSEYPAERIQFMLNDVAATLIVTSQESSKKLQGVNSFELVEVDSNETNIVSQSKDNVKASLQPSNLAYIIYTSGSTGKPKGVMVEHGNVVSLVKDVDYVSLRKEDILLSTGSPSFDATTFEYWGMLLNGGQLVLARENTLLDVTLLKSEITKRKVTTMWFTSSWFNQLVDTDISVFASLVTILVGGEKLSEIHIGKVRRSLPAIRIINGYGPTENTTFSLTYRITDANFTNTIPIGRPLTNRTVYIVDKISQLVPVGVPGEILLGGAGLSRGYLNRPELTAEKFIKNPFSKEKASKLYKTGDLGRLLPNGNIEYLGRIDNQVKIRGYRIELQEIENVLQQNPAVSQSLIVAKTDVEGNKVLVGYVISNGKYDEKGLVSYLKERLPSYMIPGLWVDLEKMPLTANGKVDLRALPDPKDTFAAKRQEIEKPVTETEKKLVEIWEELLGVRPIGVTDNFFQLGGHSLMVMQLKSLIHEKLKVELEIKDLFQYPTIKEISKFLEIQSDNSQQGDLSEEFELLVI
ncbi:non-ribosomal peptide synthetase [Segetibacter aerophilus]|uniref:Carrier domain-containing protein n=1 Tax=Segetibacter aerophilus TaxID=670293 RepID=A0A512BJU1_9BACT|nr:non-ribosomal peptide synthetase [Segetibacter aerophilus]GEO12155.1 hypothetical protein SAE01_46510 [Segetibacter aerophilus]